jgi:hypothetical protein
MSRGPPAVKYQRGALRLPSRDFWRYHRAAFLYDAFTHSTLQRGVTAWMMLNMFAAMAQFELLKPARGHRQG